MKIEFKKNLIPFGSAALILFCIVAFQNCSSEFSARQLELASQASMPSHELNEEGSAANDANEIRENQVPAPLIYFASGDLVDDCLDNSSYDACLFFKNPVAQNGGPISQERMDEDSLVPLQKFGVVLNLQGQRYLENDSVSVKNAFGYRAVTDQGSWKFDATDGQHRLGQVSAYYWVNATISEMKRRTGSFYAEGRHLSVVVDSQQTGWSSSENQIMFETNKNGLQMAFDAGTIVHLLGEANIYYATNGNIELKDSDTHHLDCGPENGPIFQKACCHSETGCSRAISAGASDYLTALMFPESPTLAEYLMNDPSGLNMCGQSRDLRLASSLKVSDAFHACDAQGAQGEVYTMGTIYASIWWEIRKSLVESEQRVFDRLYMRHLSMIDSEDDFRTLLQKIEQLDCSEFACRFSPSFREEYRRRGMNSNS